MPLHNENGKYVVNIPFNKDMPELEMYSDIPNNGKITLKIKTAKSAGFRIYDWMTENYTILVNGKPAEKIYCAKDIVCAEGLKSGDEVSLVFPIETIIRKEIVSGKEYSVYWRACDVVDITPKGGACSPLSEGFIYP